MHWHSAVMQHGQEGSVSTELFKPEIDTRAAGGQSPLSLGWNRSTCRKKRAGPAIADISTGIGALFSASGLIPAQLRTFLSLRKTRSFGGQGRDKTQQRPSRAPS